MSTKQIPIADITLDPRLQMRVEMSTDAIEDYTGNLDALPPCKVVVVTGTNYLTSGWHRYHAFKKGGRDTLPCTVTEGDFEDAVLEAAAENHDHGIRRSPEDKRKAIREVLETTKFADKSDRMIAEHCHVSEHTVAAVRKQQTTENKGNGKGRAQTRTSQTKRLDAKGREQPATKPPQPLCASCARLVRVHRKESVKGCEDCKALRGAAKPDPKPKPTTTEPVSQHTARCAIVVDTLHAVYETLQQAIEGSPQVFKSELAKQQKKLVLVMADIDLILEKPAPANGKFVKPTVEEVAAYCKERGNRVDAETFVDFYESKGWKVGTAAMKDWKASVRTWEKNAHGTGQRTGPHRVSSQPGSAELVKRKTRVIDATPA